MATTTGDVNMKQLEGELTAAGIAVGNGIGSRVDGTTTTVHGYDAAGKVVDLPGEAQGVLDSHEAQPIVDPRIAVIDDMDSISDADKAALKSLITG